MSIILGGMAVLAGMGGIGAGVAAIVQPNYRGTLALIAAVCLAICVCLLGLFFLIVARMG